LQRNGRCGCKTGRFTGHRIWNARYKIARYRDQFGVVSVGYDAITDREFTVARVNYRTGGAVA